MKLIYEWYVHGDETGQRLSAGKIAKRLAEMRIPTPGETNPGYHRTRGKGMWHAYTVLSVIDRGTYAGIWRFGVRIGSTQNRRSEDERIEVEVLALVDRQTWEMAQELRQQNKQFSRRNKKHDYLLSGLIRCACKRVMRGEFFSIYQGYAFLHSAFTDSCFNFACDVDKSPAGLNIEPKFFLVGFHKFSLKSLV